MTNKKLARKWRRIARQYRDEMEQLNEQLFPDTWSEGADMTYWHDDGNLWDLIEMFGLVHEPDTRYLESLRGFWVDQDTGERRGQAWPPDDTLCGYSITCIDVPPRDEAAWDARPV